MWKIYHRSHINIAASSAASGKEALFDEQSTDVPLEMKMTLDDLNVSFRQPVNLETEREIFLSQPLVKRAWVSWVLVPCFIHSHFLKTEGFADSNLPIHFHHSSPTHSCILYANYEI